MPALTTTTGPGKIYGQEYAGKNLRIWDVSFGNVETITWSPAISGLATANSSDMPAFKFVSGDAGSSGGLSTGTSLFLSAGTSVGRLYCFTSAFPTATSGTATISRPTQNEREKRLLGARLRVYDFESVSDADTFDAGTTGYLDHAVVSATRAMSASHSGGVFTFSVTSGPSTNVRLMVWSNS